MTHKPSPNGRNRNGTAPEGKMDPSGPRLLRDDPRPLTPQERDWQGRFRAGNRGGPGNPYAKQVGHLRAAMMEAVSPDDLRAVVGKLIELAKGGNVPAIREVLDRTLGKPVEADLIERLEALESSLGKGET